MKDIFISRENGYGSIMSEYENEFSIVSGKNVNGVIYKDWAFPSYFKDGKKVAGNKAFPRGTRTGTREQTIKTLEVWLTALKAPERRE